MLQKGFFHLNSSNPDLPPETWTLDYQYLSGSYNRNLTWGKYKIVYSGGGGSGAACAREVSAQQLVYANNGYAGEERTAYVTVYKNTTKNIKGVVGAGGGYVSVYIDENPRSGGQTQVAVSVNKGTGGSGYQNGGIADVHWYENGISGYYYAWGMTGGTGGGSTSLEIVGVLQPIAKGGNGGNCRVNAHGFRDSIGGKGGGGGTTTGTGAAGSASNYKLFEGSHSAGGASSSLGQSGYVKIYRSNLKPEPL